MASPYVIGQWVRGSRFYGRRAALELLLEPAVGVLWFAGLRRIGKTSLLREAERLLNGQPRQSALYWDLQGAADADELNASLADALYDAEPALSALGVAVDQLLAADVVTTVERLLAAAAIGDFRLVVLWDEADELLPLVAAHPRLGLELGSRLTSAPLCTLVVCSSVRLVPQLDQQQELAFLARSTLRYLGPLSAEASRRLVRQDQLPLAARPALDSSQVSTVATRCGGHPYLMQLVAKRCLETGDCQQAVTEIGGERAVEYLFGIDFELLEPAEQRLLVAAAGGAIDRQALANHGQRLVALGLVRPAGGRQVTVPNRLLGDWLARRGAALAAGAKQSRTS